MFRRTLWSPVDALLHSPAHITAECVGDCFIFSQPRTLNEALVDWLLAEYLMNEVRHSEGQSSPWLHPWYPCRGAGTLWLAVESRFGKHNLPGLPGCKGKRCSCRQQDRAKDAVGLELLVCQDAQMTTLDEPKGKSRARCASKGIAAL